MIKSISESESDKGHHVNSVEISLFDSQIHYTDL